MQGKIEKWINEKNFGFINIGEAKGLFFHRNELVEGYSPKEGDTVEFEKTQTDKGPAATKVKKVEETATEPVAEVVEEAVAESTEEVKEEPVEEAVAEPTEKAE